MAQEQGSVENENQVGKLHAQHPGERVRGDQEVCSAYSNESDPCEIEEKGEFFFYETQKKKHEGGRTRNTVASL